MRKQVGALLHLRAELAQLGGHRREAVGFLHAPARDVADRARAVGEEREHRGGHRGVGNVVQVEVDRLQRLPSGRLDPIASHIDTCAPMRSSTSVKRTSPWMLSRPTPSTRTGPPPIAPAARK